MLHRVSMHLAAASAASLMCLAAGRPCREDDACTLQLVVSTAEKAHFVSVLTNTMPSSHSSLFSHHSVAWLP